MSEQRITLGFVLLAVATALAALVVIGPASDRGADRGAVLFPAFTDVNQIAALEVVTFDVASAKAEPFKVEQRDGRWTIPSHQGYPADGGGRVAAAAAPLIGLAREAAAASEDVADHPRLGVVDPVDDAWPGSDGRGARVTVRGSDGTAVADLIVGRRLERDDQLAYVRLPGERRTYVARLGAYAPSTRLTDWIDARLLRLSRDDIDRILIRTYTADGQRGLTSMEPPISLRRADSGEWRSEEPGGAAAVDSAAVNLLITRLLDLSIVDVQPKPPALAASLSGVGGARLTSADVVDLAGRGFFLATDGRMLASFGEIVVHARSGLFHAVRFGNPVGADRRAVLVSSGSDGGAPTDAASRAMADALRAHLASWYFVVADAGVQRVRLKRSDLGR